MFFYTHTWSHPVFHAGMGKPTFPAFQFVKLNPQRFCLPFTPANQVSFPLRSHSFPVEYRGPAKTATSTLNPSTSATTMSYNSHTKSTTGGKPDLKKCLAKAIRSQVSEHCGVGTPNTHRHTYIHTRTHAHTHTHAHSHTHARTHARAYTHTHKWGNQKRQYVWFGRPKCGGKPPMFTIALILLSVHS